MLRLILSLWIVIGLLSSGLSIAEEAQSIAPFKNAHVLMGTDLGGGWAAIVLPQSFTEKLVAGVAMHIVTSDQLNMGRSFNEVAVTPHFFCVRHGAQNGDECVFMIDQLDSGAMTASLIAPDERFGVRTDLIQKYLAEVDRADGKQFLVDGALTLRSKTHAPIIIGLRAAGSSASRPDANTETAISWMTDRMEGSPTVTTEISHGQVSGKPIATSFIGPNLNCVRFSKNAGVDECTLKLPEGNSH